MLLYNYGETPLFDACRSRSEVVVKYLVKHGTYVNQENENSSTPLFFF